MRLQHLLIFLACCMASVQGHASDLSDKLRGTDYVLLMRHTSAPGVGDPANYNLDQCHTQRNLSPEGRKQANGVGRWLKKQGVLKAQVFSSAWCRCKDTAELLGFNGFAIEPSLGSFFDNMDQATRSTQNLQQFISAQLKNKGNQALILVTHHVNIHAFMGENVDSGDLVLAKVDGQGKMLSYTVIARPQ
jgi:phosphohistidine phosphatase SixA